VNTTHHPPMLVTDDRDLRDAVSRVAAQTDTRIVHFKSPAEARRSWPTAAVVMIGDDVADEVCRAAFPRRDNVLLIGRDLDDASVWRRGEALGAQQVLYLPDATPWLRNVLAEAGGTEPDTEPKPSGPIIAVLSGRGGAGASTLAAALALTATRSGLRTTLVDLDPIGGGIDLLFGVENAPGPRWSELSQWRDRELCGQSLRAALPHYDDTPRRGGLPILTWPHSTAVKQAADPIRAEASRAVLGVLAQAGDLVVVDVPRCLDEAAVEALSVATVTLMLVPAEIRAITAASQLAATARRYASDLRIVVRTPSPSALTPTDVVDAVGLPLAGEIKVDRRASVAAEYGEPPGTVPRGTLAGFCRPFLDGVLGTSSRAKAMA
jgi:secretion/DNA translocation related CpaE-like protein